MRINTHPNNLSFQKWFAWRPVWVEITPGHGAWVWLETIHRRWVIAEAIPYVNGDSHWEYKLPE